MQLEYYTGWDCYLRYYNKKYIGKQGTMYPSRKHAVVVLTNDVHMYLSYDCLPSKKRKKK